MKERHVPFVLAVVSNSFSFFPSHPFSPFFFLEGALLFSPFCRFILYDSFGSQRPPPERICLHVLSNSQVIVKRKNFLSINVDDPVSVIRLLMIFYCLLVLQKRSEAHFIRLYMGSK